MKSKHFVIVLALFLFSSCIVKSLYPFYIENKISFNEALIGSWIDQNEGKWLIESYKDKEKWKSENENQNKITEEDLLELEKYKDAYVLTYNHKENGALFIVMPFLVGNDLFVDFEPIYYESDGLNTLVAQHLFKTHSVAKVDLKVESGFDISFLSQSKVEELLRNDKLKIKHEKTYLDEDLLLTASSEELYKFLTKYQKADIHHKWSKEVYKLRPVHAKH